MCRSVFRFIKFYFYFLNFQLMYNLLILHITFQVPSKDIVAIIIIQIVNEVHLRFLLLSLKRIDVYSFETKLLQQYYI